jgi:hypothetical protein
VKNVGEPCAGKSHARFDVGGGRKPGQSAQPRGPSASRRPYRHLGPALASGADELQQCHVGVTLPVLLRRHCDSEPIGPLAESTSLS